MSYYPKSNNRVINVASIPQRSPFRYPGGKTWLVPQIRKWMKSRIAPPLLFVEPFLGGGIVSLTACFEELAKDILMVELDDEVASVWETILSGNAARLATRIMDFELTAELVTAELKKSNTDRAQTAFNTILKNRTFHGGILAPGAGLLKRGENGNGIKSRWYPKTLHDRIMAIATHRDRLTFVKGDAFENIAIHKDNYDAVFFIDPPYTAGRNGKRAGKRLYRHSELDHVQLFQLMSEVKGDFLITYDNDPEVVALADSHGFQTRLVAMKSTHHAEMNELLIGRDLDWVDEEQADIVIAPQHSFEFTI